MSLKLSWDNLPAVPDQEGFAAPFTGVSNGGLLVCGGAKFPDKRPWEGGVKKWFDSIYVLPGPGSDWKLVGRLSRPNAYGVSVSYSDAVVCAGGGDSHEHFREVFTLSWESDCITQQALPPLPRPCAFMCGALSGSILYLAGGTERPNASEAMNSFWRLDLDRPEAGWCELPAWPGPPRALAIAATVGNRFYLIGGHDLRVEKGKNMRVLLRDAYAYEPACGWKRLADLPRSVVAAPSPAPVTLDGQVLVLTGDDGTRTHLDGPSHPGFPRDVIGYDPKSDRWLMFGEVPFSRATVPTTTWRGRWIIPCGERIPGYRSNEVWTLSAVAS